MNGTAKILAAAPEARDPGKMTGTAKIMAAASDGREPPRLTGVQKIDAAAGDRTPSGGVSKILRAAGAHVDDGSPVMLKAITRLERLAASAARPKRPARRIPLAPLSTWGGAPPRRPEYDVDRLLRCAEVSDFSKAGWTDAAFFRWRELVAGDIRRRELAPTPEAITWHAAACARVDRATGAEWAERFLRDAQRHRDRRRRSHKRASGQ